VTERKLNRQSRKLIIRKRPKLSKYKKSQAAANLSRPKNCAKKQRYASREEALEHCNRLQNRIAMYLTPMEAYYCDRHNAWHVGHDWIKYRRNNRS